MSFLISSLSNYMSINVCRHMVKKKNNQNLNEMSKCNWFLRYSQKFVMTNSVPYKSGKDYIQNHMQLFCRTFEFSMFHEKRKKRKLFGPIHILSLTFRTPAGIIQCSFLKLAKHGIFIILSNRLQYNKTKNLCYNVTINI